MKKEQKIIYYSDEVNDDFAGTDIVRKPLPQNYEYLNTGFWQKLRRFFVYDILIRFVLAVYVKFIARIKYVNKKAFKGYKKRSCFIYGNHTSMVADASNPSYLAFPRPADIIINADAMSIKGIGWIVKSGGGFPIPENYTGMKKFRNAIGEAVNKKHWIAIYPEAHIWRFCTKIRNFPSTSFAYPVKYKTPVFSYTMVYKKRKRSAKPKRMVCVDGPFFPDETLPDKEAVKKLRDEVYNAMCKRAEMSDWEYIKYVYRPAEEPENELH